MFARIVAAVLFLSVITTAIQAQEKNFQIAGAGNSVVLLNAKTGATWILDAKTKAWMPLQKAPEYPATKRVQELLKVKAKLEAQIKMVPKAFKADKAKLLIAAMKMELERIQTQLDSLR